VAPEREGEAEGLTSLPRSLLCRVPRERWHAYSRAGLSAPTAAMVDLAAVARKYAQGAFTAEYLAAMVEREPDGVPVMLTRTQAEREGAVSSYVVIALLSHTLSRMGISDPAGVMCAMLAEKHTAVPVRKGTAAVRVRAASAVVEHVPTGSDLRRMRLARGMTQDQLAEVASVTRRVISEAENGIRTRQATLLYLARYVQPPKPEAIEG
jgi:DNA-binding XRE family transcriptional regulator